MSENGQFFKSSSKKSFISEEQYVKMLESCKSELTAMINIVTMVAEEQEELDKKGLCKLLDTLPTSFNEKFYLQEYIKNYNDPIKGVVRNKSYLSEKKYSTEGERFVIAILGDNLEKDFKEFMKKEFYPSYASESYGENYMSSNF
jgi:hypothetical protein